MAGVSLARLLWRIPVDCLMTLFASLLLERRIIMVCTSKDTLSAAIHAAAALIYPFEWPHRFYLPLMPHAMRDYLQAPFPFLVGLPAELMDFRGLEMDDVTLIDLDLGTCIPEAGSEADDASRLPHRASLQEALHEAVKSLRSPTEFEGNLRISDVVTEYAVRLFKHYRRFIVPQRETLQIRQRGCLPLGRLKSKNARSVAPRGLDLIIPDEVEEKTENVIIEGHGFYFDHTKFVAAHKSKSDREFLDLFRHSQMYEVFICQRLEMAALGVYPKEDTFEYKINLINSQSKLTPGHLPYRNWSRRVLSNKFSTSVKSRSKDTPTTTLDFRPQDNQLEPLMEDYLETVSKRRLSVPNWKSRSSHGSPTIKNVVAEMAKQSSRRLSRSNPNSFLFRSRASFIERANETADVADDVVADVAEIQPQSQLEIQSDRSSPSDDLPIIQSEDLGITSSLSFSFSTAIPDAIDLEADEFPINVAENVIRYRSIDDLCIPSIAVQPPHHGPIIKFSPNEKIPSDLRFDYQADKVPNDMRCDSQADKVPNDMRCDSQAEKIPNDMRFEGEMTDNFVERNLRQLANGEMHLGLSKTKKPVNIGRS